MKRTLLLVALTVWICITPAFADGIGVGGRVLVPGGAPLSQADVQLLPLTDGRGESGVLFLGAESPPAARVLTDEAGRFRIDAPHAGLWKVRVEAPGFAPQEAALKPLIEPLELADVTLATDTGVKVRVVDTAGAPVAGAFVLVRTDRRLPAGLDWKLWNPPLRAGATDADGTVRLSRGQAERISVTASAPGFGVAEQPALRGTAATLSLPTGAPRGIEVLTPSGQPVPHAAILAGPRAHPVAVTDETGHATLQVSTEGTEVHVLAGDGRRLTSRVTATPKDGDAAATIQPIVLPDQALISGRLIDADSRRAIPHAVVYDADQPITAAVTDRAGGFVLGGIEGDRLQVTAGAPGYLPPDRTVELQLAADGRPGPTLALRPAAAIEGRVTDGDASPVTGAKITLEEKQTRGMMRIEIGMPKTPPRAITDAEGRYRLSPIDPEKNYTVKARAEGYAPADTLAAGLEPYTTREDVDLTLARGVTMTGAVLNEYGLAVVDAIVTVEQATGGGHMGMMRVSRGGASLKFEGRTDVEGRFAIPGLPVGTFDVTAQRKGFARGSAKGIEIADGAAGPIDAGEIVLLAGETVQGRVVDRDGAPIEGVEIAAGASGGPQMMVMIGGGPPPDATEPDAVTDSTGWFSVSDLSPKKKYTVHATRTGYIGANAGPLPLPRVEPVVLTLDEASTVRGHVRDEGGEPIAGAKVDMTRSRTIEMGNNVMKTIMMLSETTDGEGQFVFEDQEPGEMSLKALASGFQEGKLDGLKIPKGEDLENIELKLPGGAVVTGQVFGPDGRPVIGASVQVAGEGEAFMRMMEGAPSDGNGIYRLEGLAAGPVSIEATHDDWPRTVRDADVDLGINSLDLYFEGGIVVQGRVHDASGEPVPGATVRLMSAGRAFGGPETLADSDGNYSMPGVQDGSYTVWAQANGYAASFGDVKVEVQGEPLYDVNVELDPGAAIAGRVNGLESERLGDVTVQAQGAGFGGFDGVGVDSSGGYRIENLKPGDYTVVATVANSGKRASDRVTIDPGAVEATLDLQFEAGLVLSGRAVQGDAPVRGATVYVEGTSVQHTGWNETDHDGQFEIDGLEPGDYTVNLRDWRTGLAYDEDVSLTASQQIVLRVPTARVGGRIVDTTDRQPLGGVRLTLTSDATTTALAGLPMHSATSDLEGKFEFGNVGDGTWTLSASKQGYAAQSQSVAVQSERTIDNLKLTMDPTEGVTLETRLPSGAAPAEVRVAVLDPAGGALMSGNYATGENGRVRLSSIPPGSWSVVVSAAGSATSRVQVQAPGPAIPVSLQPATSLRVLVPELEGEGLATVRLSDASGQPYYGLTWSGRPRREWPMQGGSTAFAELPPGSWTVSVTAADGRSWQGSQVTTSGSAAELRLE